MKIIRWFLSHIFLILLVVMVIYGYMFWGNLIGKDTPAGKTIAYLSNEFVVVEEFVEAVKAKQAQLSADNTDKSLAIDTAAADSKSVTSKPVEIEGVVVEEEAPAESTITDGYKQTAEVRPTPVPVVMSQHNQASTAMTNGQRNAPDRSVQSAAGASASRADNEQVAALAPPSSDTFISANVEKQLDNVDNNGKVIDPDLKTVNVRTSWFTARKSYYQRKYDVSEKSYMDVIENTQDNFDAYGELGNVYFNQGKNKLAAQAYFSAASILVRKGQVNRARSLLGLLRHLDKEKAVELQTLITSASS